jgi:hypothetical protein
MVGPSVGELGSVFCWSLQAPTASAAARLSAILRVIVRLSFAGGGRVKRDVTERVPWKG